jgi:hypothetical protein
VHVVLLCHAVGVVSEKMAGVNKFQLTRQRYRLRLEKEKYSTPALGMVCLYDSARIFFQGQ